MNLAHTGSTTLRIRLAGVFLALIGCGAVVAQGVSTPVPLFTVITGHTSNQRMATALPVAGAHQTVALQTAAMFAMRAGQAATIETPSGAAYALTYERTETGYGGGKTWVGYLTQYGKNYPVLISVYRDRVNGTLATPMGKHRLLGTVTNAVLTDIKAAQEPEFAPSQDDAVPVPELKTLGAEKKTGDSASTTPAAQALPPANAGNPAQIDVLFLYTPGFSSALGGDSGAVARVNLLVATANTVYANSGIYVRLNAAAVSPYSYSDNDTVAIDDALKDIEPYYGSATSIAIESLRNNANADLVSLLREFKTTAATVKSCGLAVIPDPANNSFGLWAHSVVDDVRANGSAACDGGHTSAGDTAPTHEIGHNMGAAHDLYTSSASGIGKGSPDGSPSYNRGYCNGSAGSVMAYSSSPGCTPLVPYFSNPALNACNGSCGVPIGTAYSVVVNGSNVSATGADSTTAINANAPYMAAYRSIPPAGAPVCNLSLVPNTLPSSGGVAAATATCTNSPTSYTWGNVSGVGNVTAINIRFPANTTQNSQTYAISVAASNANGTGNPAIAVVTVAASAPAFNLNQHGLTGSWGRANTPGTRQGFLFNFYPDNVAAGHGTVFAGWYTFDVAGGSGGQRWYALQGDVYSNSSSASLTIYTAADGNLNSGSKPANNQVGTATLSFSDCSTGTLVYSFNDGRAGSIPLTRVTHSTATCGTSGDTGAAAQNYLLSGAWIVPATVGMGFVIDVSPADHTLLGSWYTYFPAGNQAPSPRQQWFVFQDGNFAPTQISSSNLDLLQPGGGTFDATVGGGVTTTTVGSVSLTFTSCTTATFTYAIPTESVSQNTVELVRLGPAPAGCALP